MNKFQLRAFCEYLKRRNLKEVHRCLNIPYITVRMWNMQFGWEELAKQMDKEVENTNLCNLVRNDEYFSVSEQKKAALSRQSLSAFAAYAMEFPISKMHQQWCEYIENYDRVLIVAPRFHGKTTLGAIISSLYFVGKNPNVQIKIISCSDKMAVKIVNKIVSYCDSQRFKQVFPEITFERGKRHINRLFVQRSNHYLKDPTVESLGVTAQAEGGRADILICDDIVTCKNSKTEGLRNLIKEQFFNVHMNLIGPSGKVIYIATKWHAQDLTHQLIESGKFKVLEYAIDDDFNSLWPQVWPRESLIRRCMEIGIKRFNMGFRNIVPSEYVGFSHDCFQKCVDPELTIPKLQEMYFQFLKSGAWKTVVGVDLASGFQSEKKKSGKKLSNNVIFTCAFDVESKVRIPIDIKVFQASAPNVCRILVDTYNRYKPEVIMVESNGYQVTLKQWSQELLHLPIFATFTSDHKFDPVSGIRSLEVELDNMLWRIPKWDHTPDCNCGWCIWKKELLSFPYNKRDDTIMAWWHCREGIRRFFLKSDEGRFAIWEF